MDLRDELWGAYPIGIRRLVALVRALPAESATISALVAERQDGPRTSTRRDGWEYRDRKETSDRTSRRVTGTRSRTTSGARELAQVLQMSEAIGKRGDA